MGITIHPASHSANAHPEVLPQTANTLLFETGNREHAKICKELLQSSFDSTKSFSIVPKVNGFVQACIHAYSDHRHLIIRPDDVWITILTQLSLYSNAHAEELRSIFVQHEGKKEVVVVELDAGRYDCDWEKLVGNFAVELEKNIKDPSLKDWMLQEFSTTTKTDRAVGAIAMMGTLQAYFSYKMYMMCGIPSVTLEGTREDWVKLRDAVIDPKRLPMFGKESKEWSRVLGVVLNRFVDSYDDPDSLRTKEFWQNIAHYSGGGSGPRYWSGWITAFCFWDDKGQFLRGMDSGLAKGFKSGIGSLVRSVLPSQVDTTLRIDGQVFHRIDSNDVPPAWVSIPVIINELGTEYKARIVAGVMGYNVSKSGQKLENGEEGLDTLKPQTGWWIYEERPET